jgi:uncharacterized protein (DUF305 family)
MMTAETSQPAAATPRWSWPRWLVPTLLAVLMFAVGFGAGVWIAINAVTSPADDSVEAGFARDMTSHHTQAVAMAITEWDSTTHAVLKVTALDILATQQGQIGQMQAWLSTWGLSPNGSTPSMAWMSEHVGHDDPGTMPGMVSQEQLARLESATGRDKDVLFCQLMIEHHEGAVVMADAVLARSEHRQVRNLAETIKRSQRSEIDMLTRVLGQLQAES